MGGVAKVLLSPIGALVGAFDHKKKKTADAPDYVNPMLPMSDDKNVAAAKKQAMAMQLARAGRTSTILTDTTESLGGGL